MSNRTNNSSKKKKSASSGSGQTNNRNPIVAATPRAAPPARQPTRGTATVKAGMRKSTRQKIQPQRYTDPSQPAQPLSKFPYENNFKLTRNTTFLMTVIGMAVKMRSVLSNQSIWFVPTFSCRMAESCTEAKEGLQGSRAVKGGYPGIPEKKFTRTDQRAQASGREWPVQAFFESENPNKWQVLFEGYDSTCMADTSKTDCNSNGTFEVVSKFLKALMILSTRTVKDLIEKHIKLAAEYRRNPTHVFWTYQDLSYFHTKLQEEEQQTESCIAYFCFAENMVQPPQYQYSSNNVVEDSALNRCMAKLANKSFKELSEMKQFREKGGWNTPRNNGVCENSNGCKCNGRYQFLYSSNKAKNLQPRADGTLDLSSICPDKKKILVECSNECGCTSSCMRRQLQKGQRKSLAVVDTGTKGFGLKAMEPIKAGEFITEYAGLVFSKSNKTKEYIEKKDSSYEAAMCTIDNQNIVIDSEHIGNVSRFANHHCDPNAMFIETESRVDENDPLIPRISVYARKDIAIGEWITIRYWPLGGDVDEKGIRCDCGARVCIKYLPTKNF